MRSAFCPNKWNLLAWETWIGFKTPWKRLWLLLKVHYASYKSFTSVCTCAANQLMPKTLMAWCSLSPSQERWYVVMLIKLIELKSGTEVEVFIACFPADSIPDETQLLHIRKASICSNQEECFDNWSDYLKRTTSVILERLSPFQNNIGFHWSFQKALTVFYNLLIELSPMNVQTFSDSDALNLNPKAILTHIAVIWWKTTINWFRRNLNKKYFWKP